MSSSITDIAAKLADDVMAVQDETGADRLFMEVAGVIGAASQTLEEAFLTEVRIRLAERKGRDFLTTRVAELRASSQS